MFGCSSAAVIYYADTKKRMDITFGEADFEALLIGALSEMRACIAEGRIPPVRERQVCSGCSMKDLCMPAAGKRPVGLRKRIAKALEAEA